METGNYIKAEHPVLDRFLLLLCLFAIASMLVLTFLFFTRLNGDFMEALLSTAWRIDWRYFAAPLP